MEHNLLSLGSICDQYIVDVTKIIEQTRKLNVTDTDRRRTRRKRRRKRQRQQVEDSSEPHVDQELPIVDDQVPDPAMQTPRIETNTESNSGHQP